MGHTQGIIAFVFGIALFINAILFIPQAVRIITKKTAKGVSLTTFLGFLAIQFAIVLHGIVTKDYLLMAGYILSMLTCGAVVVLIFYYRNIRHNIENVSSKEILQQLPCHIYWKNKEGVFLGCNSNNLKDFGLNSLSEFIGKTDYDLFTEQEAARLRLNDENVMRTKKIAIFEEELTTATGKKILFLSHKTPLKNNKNQIIGVLGVSVDITSAKQKVIDQLETLENVIAVMPGNVYWMDRDGVYLGCNDNEARAVGISSRKDIIGKRNIDIPGFVIPEALNPINEKVLKTGQLVVAEEPVVLSDGTEGTYLSSKVPLHNSHNEIIGIVGISIDITDRKNQEAELRVANKDAEAANKIKAEFIHNMEHDIRTPFVGIYGMVDLLAHQETDPNKKATLNEVSLCAKELMDYCDDILDFSRIEADSFPVVSKSFSLKKFIDSVMAIEMVVAKHKNIDFTLNYDNSLPSVVIGDSYRLKRILLNLISNAIKFTKEGYVKLAVGIEKHEEEERFVVLKFAVEDSGIGVPDDKKALIYERFTKVVPSNKGLYRGLGLGLRIVKQFVAELNGDIHLQSELAKGSKFTVYLPFKIPLSSAIIDEE